jgi:predicted dehydrogenase
MRKRIKKEKVNMLHRREFIMAAGATGLALGAEKTVRIGIVGVGNRGTMHLNSIFDVPGVEVPAICDINEANLSRGLAIVEKAGHKRPEGYSRGVEDFRRMVARDDLDAVITATPWEWHVPIAVASMKAGKYAAVEVPAAPTLDECWDLVNTSEQTGVPCMLLENACYRPEVLMVLNLIRHGELGEISYCEGGYQHFLGMGFRSGDAISWRTMHSVKRNANVYPTHGVGPVSWWININRGDRFTHLVSMSSKSQGLNAVAASRFGADSPNATRKYAMGDVNVSLLRTQNGVAVTLIHDVQLPRPYDLGFRVQGTKGLYSWTLQKIYVDGRSPAHTWEDLGPYFKQYDDPIWKSLGINDDHTGIVWQPNGQPKYPSTRYGDGGGDYVILQQFVKAVRNKTQPPIDVYDAATWSAITSLSEQSVAAKSAPIDFPDFTRGKWKTAKPVAIEA